MSVSTSALGAFGVQAHGIDLSRPMDAAQFSALESAFYRAHLMVLRGQRLDAAGFHTWASRFGRPEPHVKNEFHHPLLADILLLSNVVKAGVPQGLADAGTYFHTDYSYLPQPARATTLYSIQVPQVGGDTLFADQSAAWDDLPADFRRQIRDRVVLHHYGNRDDLDERSRTAAAVLNEAQKARMGWVRHPLVVTHPFTGREALYAVSGSSFGIDGLPDREGRELLDQLKAHATHPRYQLRLSYGVGDVVIWDNMALLHAATLTDPRHPRTLWRITVKPT